MTPDAPGRARRGWSPAWCITAGVLLAIALAWTFAADLGLERLPLVAGLVGPRNAVTLALAAAGVLLLVAGLVLRRARRALLPLAAAVLLAAAASLPAMLTRGFSDGSPTAARAGEIRILSWNINGDLVPPAAVARLAARERADIVVLPEITPHDTGARYAPAFADAGLRMRAYPAIADDPVETVVFVRTGLGTYSPAVGHSDVPEKSAVLTPRSAGLPGVVAIHAAQPTLGDNPQWRSDLDWVAERCQDPNTIAVGDFNATLDGFGTDRLGGCDDAAAALHAASLGTWPTALPRWAGMPLDHVLTGRDWRARSFSVLTSEDRSGARHRPILAVVAHR